MVPEGEKQPTVQLSYDAYEPQQTLTLHDNPKGEVVACMPWQ